ncbi:MAG: relaxase/mobilization nuclease domain-containing protein [Ruminococcus sp.]|nr:relaxase/mobilization nuclease domain-containing protein [Ruminococcus sp.]
MAVSKLWAVRERLSQVIDYATNPQKTDSKLFTEEDYQSLKDVIAYAKDETKTEYEYFCDGINCNVAIAREQFITAKEQFQKTNGIQAYHGYLSFPESEVSPELCQKIGMEFAQKVWGDKFQVVVTTHLNTKHLHCHFVVNSVSFVDGKRIDDNEKRWFYFRHIADELCKKYKLSWIENPTLTKKSSYLTMQDKAGMPTRYNIVREVIDYAIEHSRSMTEFKHALEQRGYKYKLNPNLKYWTVVPKGYNKPIRLKALGEDYTNARIEERLRINRENWNSIKPFPKETPKPRRYRLQTREDKIKRKDGLYRLYLYYCYKLGYLPKYKYKTQDRKRLHYLLREDLMKLDQITDEVRLLGKHQIDNAKQLFSYKSSVEERISALVDDRTHLQKIIRRKIDDKQLSVAKDKISLINGELKKLRKEIRLCDGIAERSKLIEEKLEVVLADENKIKRKENRSYEQRW